MFPVPFIFAKQLGSRRPTSLTVCSWASTKGPDQPAHSFRPCFAHASSVPPCSALPNTWELTSALQTCPHTVRPPGSKIIPRSLGPLLWVCLSYSMKGH